MIILTIFLIILFYAIIVWLCVKISENILNLHKLKRKDAPMRNGMVYNKKTKKLESDQSKVLPFN